MDSTDIQNAVSKLTPRQRSAFALACGERAARLYDDLADPYVDAPLDAIELGWKVFEGANVENASLRMREIQTQMLDSIPKDDSGNAPTISSGGSACEAMAAAIEGELRPAIHSALSMLDALSYAAESDETAEVAVRAEIDWQCRALEEVRNSKSLSRESLADLIGEALPNLLD